MCISISQKCKSYCVKHWVLSSFMTYHWVFNKSSTMGTTSGAVIMYPFGVHEFSPPTHTFKWGSHCSVFSFIVHCLFVLYLLDIVLHVLRCTASEYPLVSPNTFCLYMFGYNFGLHTLIEILL